MDIPFSDKRRWLGRVVPELEAELPALIAQRSLVNSEQVRRLEDALRTYTGARFAIATANVGDALAIALKALGIGRGDEVILPIHVDVATVSSLLHVGATPVFVDIEPGGYALDTSAIEARITPRTRAIMPAHRHCQMADMDTLMAMAHRHQLNVVEDGAQAIGMRHGGVHAGLIGDLGVLSFAPTRTLGAVGDGGMVLTNDPALAERAGLFADQDRDAGGVGSHLGDLQALVLRLQFQHLEGDIRWRARCAAAYDTLLEIVPGIERRPPCPRAQPQQTVHSDYVVETDRRDELLKHLARHGISAEACQPLALPRLADHALPGTWAGDFPRARAVSDRALALPMHVDLTEADVHRIVAVIAALPGALHQLAA